MDSTVKTQKGENMNILQQLFSIKNEYINNKKYKVVTILGIKIKLKIPQPKITSIYNKWVIPDNGILIKENEEIGLGNIDIKLERVAKGGVFEHEDMIVANKAIGRHFLGNAHKVVNIGSGVGTFEYYNAPLHKDVQFVASEFEIKSTKWTQENRQLDNVTYTSDDIQTLLQKYGKFDLAVSIDVIEHIKNYKSFLDEFSLLADKAVISTPNRDRYKTLQELSHPPYPYHVQEFNVGELYYILKMYYSKVIIYSNKDPLSEELTEVGFYSEYEKLYAYCEK